MDLNFLNTKEVSIILRCSRGKARQLMTAPDFPSVRIGSAILVDETKFLEWLKGKENND